MTNEMWHYLSDPKEITRMIHKDWFGIDLIVQWIQMNLSVLLALRWRVDENLKFNNRKVLDPPIYPFPFPFLLLAKWKKPAEYWLAENKQIHRFLLHYIVSRLFFFKRKANICKIFEKKSDSKKCVWLLFCPFSLRHLWASSIWRTSWPVSDIC